MKNNIQISSLFVRDLLTPNPRRDWTVAVLLALCVGLVLVLYSGWIFYRVTTGSLVESTSVPTKPKQPVTTEEMETVREIYRVREARFQSGVASSTSPDPHGSVVVPKGGGGPTIGN
ncbi:MAG: hypothetical protein RLZZ283_616 [Candidatus Parcubacteria bacterium]|jgi:hypothetical protein